MVLRYSRSQSPSSRTFLVVRWYAARLTPVPKQRRQWAGSQSALGSNSLEISRWWYAAYSYSSRRASSSCLTLHLHAYMYLWALQAFGVGACTGYLLVIGDYIPEVMAVMLAGEDELCDPSWLCARETAIITLGMQVNLRPPQQTNHSITTCIDAPARRNCRYIPTLCEG